MSNTVLEKIVGCSGAVIRNDALQPNTDPAVTLWLETESGLTYSLPLSEKGITAVFKVIADWRRTKDFLSEPSPSPTGKRMN